MDKNNSKRNSKRLKKAMFLTAGGAMISLASAAYAGFEWTPPNAGSPAEPPAASVVLPEIPLDQEPLSLPPVVSSPAPIAAEPAALPKPQAPVMKTLKISPPQKSPQKIEKEIVPPEKKPPQTVQRDIDFLPIPVAEPSVQNVPTPKQQTLAVPVPVETKPIAPPVIQAEQSEPEIKKLSINPYPSVQNAKMSMAQPSEKSSAPTETTNGFGTDVPMALAIQQIAPPGVAFSFEPGINVGNRVSWEGKDRPWMDVLSDVLSPFGMRAVLNNNVVHITQDGTPAAPPAPTIMGGSEDHSAAEPTEKPETKKMAMTDVTKPSDKPPQNILAAEDIRRKSVMDPGEEAHMQAASAMADIEPAVGTKANPADLPLWEAQKGESLKNALTAWSNKAGVSMSWKAAQDFTLETGVLISGEFKTAVNVLIAQGLAENARKPSVAFTDDNKALVVADTPNTKEPQKTTP